MGKLIQMRPRQNALCERPCLVTPEHLAVPLDFGPAMPEEKRGWATLAWRRMVSVFSRRTADAPDRTLFLVR